MAGLSPLRARLSDFLGRRQVAVEPTDGVLAFVVGEGN